MANLDLDALAAPLEALRGDLTAAYKRLDEQWKAIAERLEKLPIPCTVGHIYSHHPDEPDEYMTLEWRKWKGKKRICIVHNEEALTPNGDNRRYEDVTPYEEWSAEQRVEMLQHLPALFAAAEKQTKEFIAQIMESEARS